MKRLFWFLALIFLSEMLLAGSSSQATLSVHNFTTAPSAHMSTDLSTGYLAEIFGSVGYLKGAGTIVGQLLLKLNQGLCVLTGLFLFYNVGSMMMRSAHDGSFMQQNKNVTFVIFRVAFGVGLLVPNPGTGYSALQATVMSVAIQGVGLANQTWSWALGYIQNGGTLFPAAKNTQQMGEAAKNGMNAAQNAFQSLACTYYYQNQASAQNSMGLTGTNYHWADNGKGLITFPGAGGKGRDCGTISYVTNNNTDGKAIVTEADKDTMSAPQQGQAIINQVIADVQPAAKKFADSINSPTSQPPSPEALDTDIRDGLLNATMDYVSLIQPLAHMAATNGSAAAQGELANAAKDGWMMAGRYYWSLSRAQKTYEDISKVVIGGVTGASYPKGSGIADVSKYVNEANTDVAKAIGTNQSGVGNAGAYENKGDGEVNSNDDVRRAMGMLGSVGNLMADLQKTNVEPSLYMQKIGQDCIGMGLDFWIGGAILSALITLAGGACGAANPVGASMEVLSIWLVPTLTVISMGSFAVGATLGYYVPLYPYIMFSFGCLGWMIAIVEAMIAAPLICLGLTHPEGHDFLGKAEQAIMLLVGIFLRPVLMVIGLIMAIILSYVALKMINYGFHGILSAVFGSSGSIAKIGFSQGAIVGSQGSLVGIGGLMGMFAGPMGVTGGMAAGAIYMGVKMLVLGIVIMAILLGIYTTIVYTVMTQSFALIHVLPDKILRWIGSPSEQSDFAGVVGQMKGEIGNSAKGGAQHVGYATDKASAPIGRMNDAQKNRSLGGKA